MTKQEKIREGIENLRREAFGDCGSGYFTDALIKYLHSQGVVIQVVPDDTPQIYRAVEPII